MSGPVVLVTGASKGIGLSILRILVDTFHAKVVTLSRTCTPELESFAKVHPEDVEVVLGDVTDEAVNVKAVQAAKERYGGLDGVVFNAGVLDPMKRLADMTPDDLTQFRSLFDINFFSIVQSLRHVLPLLRESKKGGKIVLVSSGSSVGGSSATAAYNASKAALNSLGRTLATEEPSIMTVAVRPGVVDTAMQTVMRTSGKGNMLPHEHKRFIDLHEGGKLIHPDDPGHVIAKLVFEGESKFSGQFVSWDSEELKEYRSK